MSTRRRRRPISIAGLAAAAAAAYGTYKVVEWAWHRWKTTDNDDDRDDSDDSDDNDDSRLRRMSATRASRASVGGTSSSPSLSHYSLQGWRRKERAAAAAADAAAAAAAAERIARCRAEARGALADFYPTLRDAVEARTDFAPEAKALRSIRAARAERARAASSSPSKMSPSSLEVGSSSVVSDDRDEDEDEDEDDGAAEEEEREMERELWSAIKIKSISRMVATAYAHSALLLMLTVQVHLLGGRLFRDELEKLDRRLEGGEKRQRRRRQSRRRNRKRREDEKYDDDDNGDDDSDDDRDVTTRSGGFGSGTGKHSVARSASSLDYRSARSSEADDDDEEEDDEETETETETETEEMTSYQRSHRIVLTRTYQHFFDRGLRSLIDSIDKAVSDVMAEWDVTDPSSMDVTRERFGDWIDQIRWVLEERGGVGIRGRIRHEDKSNRSSRRSSSKHDLQGGYLVQFFVPADESTVGAEMHDDLALYILEETWDVLESPAFEMAEKDCLDCTFRMLEDEGWSSIFLTRKNEDFDERWIAKPLALIVTQLRHASNTFYAPFGAMGMGLDIAQSSAANAYVSKLEKVPTVVELGLACFS